MWCVYGPFMKAPLCEVAFYGLFDYKDNYNYVYVIT